MLLPLRSGVPFLLRVFRCICTSPSTFVFAAGLSTFNGTISILVDFLVGLADLLLVFFAMLDARGSASTVTRILHGLSPPAPFGVSNTSDFDGLI